MAHEGILPFSLGKKSAFAPLPSVEKGNLEKTDLASESIWVKLLP